MSATRRSTAGRGAGRRNPVPTSPVLLGPTPRSPVLLGPVLIGALLGGALLLGGCVAGSADAGPQLGSAGGTAPGTTTSTPTAIPSAGRPSSTAAVPPATAVPPPVIPRTDAALGAGSAAAVPAPVRVQVPDLGVDVQVEPEGTDADGALALPADPDIASWYRFGPSPAGSAGSAVIASHVDSLDYGIGQFARLAGAAPGTPILVTADDGTVRSFTVQRVELAAKSGVDWAVVFDRTGPPRLTLITCGGEFDYDTGHYLSNVILTAVPSV